jgi:hypothetical protein
MKLKSLGIVITLVVLLLPARTFAQVGSISEAKAILTPAQWEKVPESIKTPGLRRGDGEGGRPERRGPGGE